MKRPAKILLVLRILAAKSAFNPVAAGYMNHPLPNGLAGTK
jgi:hypothetical protein